MITLTAKAETKVKEFLNAQNRTDLVLRIFIRPGGCSGFSFGMGLDEPKEDDHFSEIAGIRVAIDPQSFRFVKGAIVDYQESMLGGGFSITNSAVAASCSCNQSSSANKECCPGSVALANSSRDGN
ncbi:MAG: iron-sulfur cluster assembly accessory protein [Cyanobacteria bacterium NC_groundwater_1444_Ag_S-0.65um_54_12]|nr:iron-sulfur cluster assembly accessory protein [Cyanobacteria bacterium NC_groundwater_1444_Ag_S-0.65um_54_12]